MLQSGKVQLNFMYIVAILPNINVIYPTAPEHRAWLLYYAIPVLNGLLPKCYFEHLEFLVCSLHMVLGDAISTADLSLAEQMLEAYCRNFELLNG